MTQLSTSKIAELQDALRGPVILPGHSQYEELRSVWNAIHDRRPGLIARCTGTADVLEAIAFARANEVDTAIRAGGHSYPGFCTCDDGMVIDLRLMDGVRVDREKLVAVAQGGATWGQFDRETQAFGLATTGGVVSTTGIGGLTLGGGVGRLMRQFGLSCDNVISFDVVTADGELLTVDDEHHPDLFWALRGGGGNFGIVTNFQYRLHPVGPIVFGGLIGWPMEQSRDVWASCEELLADTPEELSFQVLYRTAHEDNPFMPEHLRGKRLFVLSLSWHGPIEQGKEFLRPVRETIKPSFDSLSEVRYEALQSMMDAGAPPGNRCYLKSGYITELTDEVLDVTENVAANFEGPNEVLELYLMGGAVSRVDADDTAFSQRGAGWFYTGAAMWTDPDDDELEKEWCRKVDRAYDPLKTPGSYINFLGDADDEESVRAAMQEQTYELLAKVKERYDPTNFFNRNPNVRPATVAS